MFGEYVSTPVSSPVTSFLEAREDNEKLNENEGELFHSVVAMLLFIKKVYRSDLDAAISSFMDRVSNSNVGDCEKSRRILRFVNCTLK